MAGEIGRPVPVLSHLGETGDALSNEANDFWDNAVGGTQGVQASASLVKVTNQSLLQTPPAIEKHYDVWNKSMNWIHKLLKVHSRYLLYSRLHYHRTTHRRCS
ncbi:hypothetical protein AVEN_90170-1 [Araneus ventricosus]|uniref:Uncharacterized protein n=1 Tax=Araneus ventricosus TaxID=182803 RepID=A0A4Y2SWU5_ARAVE|nr:hypothetical protein AVEN_90170-1 [Araneus ventricosus]